MLHNGPDVSARMRFADTYEKRRYGVLMVTHGQFIVLQLAHSVRLNSSPTLIALFLQGCPQADPCHDLQQQLAHGSSMFTTDQYRTTIMLTFMSCTVQDDGQM